MLSFSVAIPFKNRVCVTVLVGISLKNLTFGIVSSHTQPRNISLGLCQGLSCVACRQEQVENWSADWGNGLVLPKLLSKDQDRHRGMSFGKIPLGGLYF